MRQGHHLRAPLEIHIKMYVRAVGRDPSTLWSPPSEEELHSPSDNPHPSEETPWHLQAELGDLAYHELCQLMEDLCQEIAHCELDAPQKSPINAQGTPIGEQECKWRWPGGHLSEGGGFLQDNHLHLLPRHDKMEDRFLWDHLQPQIPTQPNPDVGCLINTLASGLHLGTSRINNFSSEAMPGKMEVSFEQWNHEVQCVKNHYPELVVWESIVRSLKGAAADMAWYMGPTTSVSNILQKLSCFHHSGIFQCIHAKFLQSDSRKPQKVSSFTMRLEGTLNQIRLKCPRQIANCKVSWHLKDQLYHEVCKHIRDSIRYLYSNLKTTYSQLMVATRKAEREMEEAKDKVRDRSAAATEVVDNSKELGDQVMRLMATWTRAEQGNCPTSTPNSPRHMGHGRGHTDRNTPTCPSSHSDWTGLGQTTYACSSSAVSWVSTASQGRGNTQAPNGTQSNAQSTRDPNLLQCFQCQGWGLGSVLLQPRC